MIAKPWEPREHQLIGADFLFNTKRCNLWAHPGLGKTSMCYRLLDLMKLFGSNFFPVLTVGPLAVARDVWPAEQQKWRDFRDLRVVPLLGDARQRATNTLINADLYTVNYDNLVWLANHFGDRWPFRTVIADESTKLRGFRLQGKGTKRASALASIADKTGRWINLTGTPSPHGLESLWGQQWFVDFGHALSESYSAYLRRWFYVSPYDRSVTAHPHARQEIYEALKPTTMALRAEDWLDVKEPHFFQRRVELPPEARAMYRQMEKQFFIDMPQEAGRVVAWNAAVKALKLVQIASGNIYDSDGGSHFLHDAKVQDLRSLYDELGENLLVAYHFQFEIPYILKEFPEAVVYKGKAQEDAWNKGEIRMMLIHPKSGGHGLNLQHGGRALYFFTNVWDLELRLQMIERIGPARQLLAGYDRAVLIYDALANKTLDENVLDRLEGRATEQEALMAARARATAS